MHIPDLGRRGEGWVVLQVAFIVLIALAGVPEPSWGGTVGAVTTGAGAALVVVGGLLAFLGSKALGPSFSPHPRPLDSARLVQTGIYTHVRHPIYGGIILGAFGWGLFVASPLALLLSVGLVVVFSLKSLREEAWLGERYPAYEEYRRRTRRFFPRLI
jgi:protein-S-isoprenylcysteine O-methyltransferase Ste14